MQKEGCGGPYLEGEALGVGITNPLIPLVGIGHLLRSVPHLGGSFQEGADLGQEDKSRLRCTCLCLAHISLLPPFIFWNTLLSPSLFAGNKSSWFQFHPSSPAFPLVGDTVERALAGKTRPESQSWVCQYPSVRQGTGQLLCALCPSFPLKRVFLFLLFERIFATEEPRANKGVITHNV